MAVESLPTARPSREEIVTAYARIDGRPIGIVANQPKVKGGVLFADSSDKAARFIWLCNAYNLPLVYLADVSGFMVGTKVERAGIIRHGAKMVFATSQATVPKISVVVRKCYGAGLYAMCGPAFEPDAALSLPQGQIAIMGPEPAVNAVYYNKIMELPETERPAYVRQKREEYARDVDIYKLASEMLVDGIIAGSELRDELIRRLAHAESKQLEFPPRRNPVRSSPASSVEPMLNACMSVSRGTSRPAMRIDNCTRPEQSIPKPDVPPHR